jgi:hypothetical protein
MTYRYRGDKLTRPDLKGAFCDAVKDERGKCVRGKNGAMLVRFENGETHVILGRQLRHLEREREREAARDALAPKVSRRFQSV